MSLVARILGCGSSGGVPRIDGDWGACNPKNPKNKRGRCSLLVSRTAPNGTTNVLIDTSPDMREQLIASKAEHIDAVVYTHDHADQTHGIDDLRALVYRHRKRIPIWMNEETSKTITTRFAYCFAELADSGYPSILEEKRISESLPVIPVEGAGGVITLQPIWLQHGRIRSLGYKIDNLIYSPDLNDIPENSLAFFSGVKTWIVDALRYTPHPTHFHLDQTKEFISKLGIPHAVLTNMHIDMDFDMLVKELPDNIEPAFDGMEISIKSAV